MPHSIELAEQLVGASNQIRELQAEVERLKDALMDIRDHSMPPFNHYKWVYYINEVSTNALSYYKEERFWCAACGSWGDHRSGTCPTITKVRSDEKSVDAGMTDQLPTKSLSALNLGEKEK